MDHVDRAIIVGSQSEENWFPRSPLESSVAGSQDDACDDVSQIADETDAALFHSSPSDVEADPAEVDQLHDAATGEDALQPWSPSPSYSPGWSDSDRGSNDEAACQVQVRMFHWNCIGCPLKI